MTNKLWLSKQQAIDILPDSETIHTFRDNGLGLIGCDWSKSDIVDEINKCKFLEITGPGARGINHGLAAYRKGSKYQSDILFIETDKAKLDALEASLTKEVKND